MTFKGTNTTVDATAFKNQTNLVIDTITFGGHSIAGTIPASGTYNDEQYTLVGTTLTVTAGDATLKVLGFSTGDFGVNIKPSVCTPKASTGQAQPQASCSSTGKVIFGGYDSNGFNNLWVTDGTSSGTHELANVPGANTYYGLSPDGGISLGSKYVFNAYDTKSQKQLWVSDGTVAGTVSLLSTSGGNEEYLDPQNFVVLNGKAYFNGYDDQGNFAVWVTDGTPAGTIELNTYGFDLTVFQNKVFFNQSNSTWITDGTVAGTHKLSNYILINLKGFVTFGSVGLFSAQNDVFGDYVGLWETDGTVAGTHPVQDESKPGFANYPDDLTVVGGKVFFEATNANNDEELWVSDGTAAGTQELTTITYGPYGSLHPGEITVLGSKVIFSGIDAQNNRGLWISDGTVSGTIELSTSAPSPLDFKVLGTQALFTDLTNELWVTDGTVAGTHKLLDDSEGFYGFRDDESIVLGSNILFGAKSYVTDEELWTSNGTAAGTFALTDFDISPYAFALLD